MVGGWMLCFVAALVGALSYELDLPSSSSLFLAMTVAYLVADCVSLTWSNPTPNLHPSPSPSPNLNLALT